MDGVTYEHSLGLEHFCNGHDISYNLERKYRTFQALVGMTNDVPTGTKLRFTVLDLDKEVARRDVTLEGPIEINADVTGILRLVLPVETLPYSYNCFPSGDGKGVAVWGRASVHR